MDSDVARDLLLNVSQLLDDAEIGDYGNETAEDVIGDGSKVYPMSSRTIFKILGIPVETMPEPITAEYNYPVVEMIDNENQGRILETMKWRRSRALLWMSQINQRMTLLVVSTMARL